MFIVFDNFIIMKITQNLILLKTSHAIFKNFLYEFKKLTDNSKQVKKYFDGKIYQKSRKV